MKRTKNKLKITSLACFASLILALSALAGAIFGNASLRFSGRAESLALADSPDSAPDVLEAESADTESIDTDLPFDGEVDELTTKAHGGKEEKPTSPSLNGEARKVEDGKIRKNQDVSAGRGIILLASSLSEKAVEDNYANESELSGEADSSTSISDRAERPEDESIEASNTTAPGGNSVSDAEPEQEGSTDQWIGGEIENDGDGAEGDGAANEASPDEDGASDPPTDTNEENGVCAEGGELEDHNPFEKIYTMILEHTGDIFSTLAFAVCLLIAFLCKKVLIPGITRVGSAIKSSVDAAVEGNEQIARITDETRVLAESRLSELDGRIVELRASFDSMRKNLDLDSSMKEREKLKELLAMEIELFFDLFMASSLPVYQKDAMNEKVKKMREKLEENE